MARETERIVTQSFLDRLTDSERNMESMTRAQSIRYLKLALRRDLEWLFNSRASHETPENFKELQESVLNYGLPDYSHMSLNNAGDRYRLQRQLELAITRFEPRLLNVSVKLTESSYEAGRAVKFQIDGLLKMDPSPEHISFDTVLDIPSGEYQVKGDSSAG